MEKPNPQIIDELEAAHPKREIVAISVTLDAADGEEEETYYFAVALPERPEWKRFQEEGLDEERRASAVENMVKTAVLYPAPADFAQILRRRPALSTTLGNRIAKLLGASTKVTVGKW